jgi:hypothetical protein
LVIESIRVNAVIRIQAGDQPIERAVIALTHHLDPVADEQCGAHALAGLIATFGSRPKVDDLGPTGGADVGEDGQVHLVVLCQGQHRSSSLEHLVGPILAGVAEHLGLAVEDVKPIPPECLA